MKSPIIYITRDIERALGILPSANYFIVTNDNPYARSIKEKYPDFVLLIKSPVPLDTFEILEKKETAKFIEKISNKKWLGNDSNSVIPANAGIQGQIHDSISNTLDSRLHGNDKTSSPSIMVFKNTARIEEFCAKKGWNLLNPSSALAEKIENKITQVEWLGELAGLLPSFKIAPAKEIEWEKKPLVLQWAHAHTGEGTIVINDAATLATLQEKFPNRPAKASEFIKGPTFTVNIVVGSTQADTSFIGLLGEPSWRVRGMGNRGIARRKNVSAEVLQIAVGNPSYQITGMPPLTDSPFATVGNDWSLPHTLLNERHFDEFRSIAEKVGEKMQESGWKGLFGIDIIYDEERDQFKLIEINARQPASTTYESQLQSKFRGAGLVGSTIFEAHLAALTGLPSEALAKEGSPLTEKQIEINDGAQIIQRVTKTLAAQMVEMSHKIADLNKAGYTTIPYPNTKPNSDFLRIQSDKGLMASHGKWNARGEKIVEILEK